jgi:hypothetical protein
MMHRRGAGNQTGRQLLTGVTDPGLFVGLFVGCQPSDLDYIARAATRGGMAEWLKALAWKACIRETVSWVRIPLPPPAPLKSFKFLHFYEYTHTKAPTYPFAR